MYNELHKIEVLKLVPYTIVSVTYRSMDEVMDQQTGNLIPSHPVYMPTTNPLQVAPYDFSIVTMCMYW